MHVTLPVGWIVIAAPSEFRKSQSLTFCMVLPLVIGAGGAFVLIGAFGWTLENQCETDLHPEVAAARRKKDVEYCSAADLPDDDPQ